MEPQYYPPQYNSSRPNIAVSKLINLFIVLLFLVSGGFIAARFVAYGKVTIEAPAHASIAVNGHRLSSNTVKLQTGSYTLTVKSPTKETYQQQFSVGLLPKTIKPVYKTRNVNAIVSSTIGASSAYGFPDLGQDYKWLDDNTWLVGGLGSSGITGIALHYQDGTWRVGYYGADPSSPKQSSLPPEVNAYLTTLEQKYADG